MNLLTGASLLALAKSIYYVCIRHLQKKVQSCLTLEEVLLSPRES